MLQLRWRNGVVMFLGLSILSAGCAALRAYPDRPTAVEAQLNEVRWCFTQKEVDEAKAGTDLTSARNDLVNCRIHAIDLQFTSFEQDLAREGVGLNTGTDLAVLGLGAATSVVGGSAVKSILGAISGGITGMKGVIDKDIFYSHTMPALLAQMEAQRKAQLVKIRTGLQLPADKYPLSEALIDVEEYYKAGSIPAAVQGIIEEAGAKADQATKELKYLQPATAKEVMQITEIRARLNTLFNAWNDAPQSDTGKRALTDAKAILKELRQDTTTDGKEVFDQLDEEVEKSEPGSAQFKKVTEAFGRSR